MLVLLLRLLEIKLTNGRVYEKRRALKYRARYFFFARLEHVLPILNNTRVTCC